MRPRHYKVYSQAQQCFWCCVGSGLENHGKYGEMIYLHDENNLYVNFFISSEVNWEKQGIKLYQTTDFPYSERTELKIEVDEPKKFKLNIRNPKWIKEGGLSIKVNGKIQKPEFNKTPYVLIERVWKTNDIVTVELPMKTELEYLPDNSAWASIVHGPIVLAAITDSSYLVGLWADDSRMGHIASGKLYPLNESPAIVSESRNFVSSVKPKPSKPLTFSIDGLVFPEKYKNLELVPFFTIHESRYIIYWPVVTSKEMETRRENSKSSEL
jgi:DUF1680 family protein